jgi:serine/threonine protein kinase
MGTVYRALDTTLGREVAIKVLSPGAANAETRRRFLREARAAAGINHPHLITVHQVDEHDGCIFLVLELLSGGSVSDLLRRRGRLDWLAATRLAIEACQALTACHDRGIVHRDLKPANLLLRDSQATSLKLSDFGLAKCYAEASTLTGPRDVLGTPDFMSPEQCRAEPVDARSDIYSLGATYYTMLTGRPPFAGDIDVQVMFGHCSKASPDPRSIVPDLPEGCAQIIRRAMAKQPGDRYANAAAMQRELESLLGASDMSSLSQPAGSGGRSKRHWLLAAGVVVPLVLLGFLIAGGRGQRPSPAPMSEPRPVVIPDASNPDPSAGRWTFRETSLPAGSRSHLVANGEVYAVALSPDGRWIAWATGGNGPVLTAVSWPDCSRVLLGQRVDLFDTIHALCFTDDGLLLASADDLLFAIDLNQQKGWRLSRNGRGNTRAIATVRREGRTLVAVAMNLWGGGGRVACYELARKPEPHLVGQPLATFELDAPAKSVAFSPDGTWLAAGSEDGTVRVWAVDPWQELARYQAVASAEVGSSLGYALAISPDSQRLVAGAGSHVLEWRLGGPDTPRVVREHRAPVTAVQFSPDGRLLASGATDAVLLGAIDAPDGPVTAFPRHDSHVSGILFSGSKFLITAGFDKHIRVHPLAAE